MKRCLIMTVLLLGINSLAIADTVDERLAAYQAEGAGEFSAERGREMWFKSYSTEGQERSCTSCHTDNAGKSGKHAKTGKPIEPMAPSVNPERLTDAKKIEKWFKRNCKWTVGRECTAQEKGDFLTYLRDL
ncbi:MAG: DUF1924 domain-containing protein [Chromatiales bacterium]|nr:DUF1924 domain-containing protein [Chromatiales bacterium]